MKDINILKNALIDVDTGLELLGDMEMYNETLADFLEESKPRLERLNKNKENSDMINYAIDAHSMKSDSKYLGFTKLAELSLNHELESKKNNIDYVNSHYEELINEVNRIIEVVRKYLG